ncbi:hypothetical protein BMS3Bbin12_02104 [bacterium BMS3Bbin12]|nr:hypothetical protein BMS3Abin12_00529 [bacterium BMS3Abin12]GBE48913.1 hypothetical protein BMS3Bbin12_02104 [bacterium BMS3Bbin12]GBE49817.1 hypothetical protein BMS3Bbin13_00740 [bacterium BMS3Bbin13]HDK03789.1 hypothetical protein [Gammaproteobacteria bacterium]
MNPIPVATPGTNEGAATVRAETSSPLFEALAGALGEVGRVSILDLGPAIGGNIEFFGRFPCALHIADAVGALAGLRPEIDPETGAVRTAPLEAEIRRQLPGAGGDTFDVILGWDLLNYLDGPVFSAFAAQLRPLLRHGTRLHAFLWSQPRMPVFPARFRILDAAHMGFEASDRTRECPRYTQRDLERRLPGLHVQRSVLLRSGLQEYVFQA